MSGGFRIDGEHAGLEEGFPHPTSTLQHRQSSKPHVRGREQLTGWLSVPNPPTPNTTARIIHNSQEYSMADWGNRGGAAAGALPFGLKARMHVHLSSISTRPPSELTAAIFEQTAKS
jgi:hypothetical protein